MSLRDIYSVKIEAHLDMKINKYMNILVINEYPKGPLSKQVKQISKVKLSDKEVIDEDQRCIYALMSMRDSGRYMTTKEIPTFYAFLKNNNYDVSDVNLQWEKKAICFIEYFY